MNLKTLRLAAVALTALLALPALADDKRAATLTILEGGAKRYAEGASTGTALAKGDKVFEGDAIETDAGARAELTLEDKSVIRVGPGSKLLLKTAYFGPKGEKSFSAKLLFGRVWSKVNGLVGGESKFEVETDNAVAGVRGTAFRVDARTDRSVLVRVYAGAVAMAPGAALPSKEAGKRKRVDGPKKITKDQWEKLVGKMMQLAVNAEGKPVGEPTAFTQADDAGDEWAAWNRGLDGE